MRREDRQDPADAPRHVAADREQVVRHAVERRTLLLSPKLRTKASRSSSVGERVAVAERR